MIQTTEELIRAMVICKDRALILSPSAFQTFVNQVAQLFNQGGNSAPYQQGSNTVTFLLTTDEVFDSFSGKREEQPEPDKEEELILLNDENNEQDDSTPMITPEEGSVI